MERERMKKLKQIRDTLIYFRNNFFQRTTDELVEYSKEADIYSISIKEGVYLFASYYNANKNVKLQGFDLWISQYSKPSDIEKISYLY